MGIQVKVEKEIDGVTYGMNPLPATQAMENIEFVRKLITGVLANTRANGMMDGLSKNIDAEKLKKIRDKSIASTENPDDETLADEALAEMATGEIDMISFLSSMVEGIFSSLSFLEYKDFALKMLANTSIMKENGFAQLRFDIDMSGKMASIPKLVSWAMEVNEFGPFLATFTSESVSLLQGGGLIPTTK